MTGVYTARASWPEQRKYAIIDTLVIPDVIQSWDAMHINPRIAYDSGELCPPVEQAVVESNSLVHLGKRALECCLKYL